MWSIGLEHVNPFQGFGIKFALKPRLDLGYHVRAFQAKETTLTDLQNEIVRMCTQYVLGTFSFLQQTTSPT
jgi:hypothetical protein